MTQPHVGEGASAVTATALPDAGTEAVPEETIGACGRRLIWLPDIGGRLALAVEPTTTPAPSCKRCRRNCPGHALFAEHTPARESEGV